MDVVSTYVFLTYKPPLLKVAVVDLTTCDFLDTFFNIFDTARILLRGVLDALHILLQLVPVFPLPWIVLSNSAKVSFTLRSVSLSGAVKALQIHIIPPASTLPMTMNSPTSTVKISPPCYNHSKME